MTPASNTPSVPEIEAWLNDAPTGLLIERIGELRRQASLLKAQADALERTLETVERIKAGKTWACKVDGCDERAYVAAGPYAYLCGPHRIAEEERRAVEGGLPGRPSHK